MSNYKVTFTQKVHETCELCARSTSMDESKYKFLSGLLYAWSQSHRCMPQRNSNTTTTTIYNYIQSIYRTKQ